MLGIRGIPGIRKILRIRRLPGMGERSFAYAKACGIIGKSFLGKRIRDLEKAGRLSELDRMIFPKSSRDLPEKELLLDLEERITSRAVDSIISIVGSFSRVPEFLALLVRGYEYADLKSAIMAALEPSAGARSPYLEPQAPRVKSTIKTARALPKKRRSSPAGKDKNAPVHTDIGVFQKVHFEAWPDIRAMIYGTEFGFLLDKKVVDIEEKGGISMQTLLDRHYYTALWKSLFSLPRKDRYVAEKILADEISLRNSSWALRLRTYYRMSPEKVMPHLINIPVKDKWLPGRKSGSRSLADEAIRCLEFPLDHFEAWSAWRWKDFINSETGLKHWTIDPRHFQNAASQYLYSLARHHFRLDPFSLNAVFCFIKLKQYEEDILTSSAEGLSIGMTGREVFSMLGVEL